MIELFKTIKAMYDPMSAMCIPYVEFRELSEDLVRTRGNRYKLNQHVSFFSTFILIKLRFLLFCKCNLNNDFVRNGI